jgi:hypothetical protein
MLFHVPARSIVVVQLLMTYTTSSQGREKKIS